MPIFSEKLLALNPEGRAELRPKDCMLYVAHLVFGAFGAAYPTNEE